jgi:hypothetical protein
MATYWPTSIDSNEQDLGIVDLAVWWVLSELFPGGFIGSFYDNEIYSNPNYYVHAFWRACSAIEALHTHEITRTPQVFCSLGYLNRKLTTKLTRPLLLSPNTKRRLQKELIQLIRVNISNGNVPSIPSILQVLQRGRFQQVLLLPDILYLVSLARKVVRKIIGGTFSPKSFATPLGAVLTGICPLYSFRKKHIPITGETLRSLMARHGHIVPTQKAKSMCDEPIIDYKTIRFFFWISLGWESIVLIK